jgi:hypothetical protein
VSCLSLIECVEAGQRCYYTCKDGEITKCVKTGVKCGENEEKGEKRYKNSVQRTAFRV